MPKNDCCKYSQYILKKGYILPIFVLQKIKIKKKIKTKTHKQNVKYSAKMKKNFDKPSNKKKVKKPISLQKRPLIEEQIDAESDQGEDLLEMVEQSDLEFLKKALVNRSYDIFKKIKYSELVKI